MGGDDDKELGEEILDRKGQVQKETPGIITQMDSRIQNINKSSFEIEEKRGFLPYPEESLCFNCLTVLCCLAGSSKEPPLLAPPPEAKRGRKCLVLDLDETLVHSSFAKTDLAHYQIPLDIEEGNKVKHFEVFVIKRPGVDKFLEAVSKVYEVVLFTASIERYADPLLKLLDPNGCIDSRLYRESCTEYRGSYVKDLRRLGRDLKNTIIVDNSPMAYQFQPENAIPCLTFLDDMSDKELDYCREFLLSPEVLNATDVRTVLDSYSYNAVDDDGI